jgi:V/A-type H+-transporting ATPase subunit C
MFFRDSTDFPENYGYLNARLRAHFSDFLGENDYRKLAGKSLEGIELFLLETRYGKSFRKGLVEQPLSSHGRIEMALADTSADILNHARSMAMGEPEDLMRVLLARADLHNCRLLLRFFFTGGASSRTPLWHGYGTLPESFFERLWKSRSITHVIDKCLAFPHPLSRSLGKACSELLKGSPLPVSERVLLEEVVEFFRQIIEKHRTKNADVVEEFLGRTIDIWNIHIWSRAVSGTMEPGKASRLYIPGGRFLKNDILEAAPGPEELFRSTPWESILSGSRGRSVGFVVSKATRIFWNWQISLRRIDPLGIEVAVAFIACQLVEWHNLNALVVGIDMGLSVESIMEKMIIQG